jgi:hypothetical protein
VGLAQGKEADSDSHKANADEEDDDWGHGGNAGVLVTPLFARNCTKNARADLDRGRRLCHRKGRGAMPARAQVHCVFRHLTDRLDPIRKRRMRRKG